MEYIDLIFFIVTLTFPVTLERIWKEKAIQREVVVSNASWSVFKKLAITTVCEIRRNLQNRLDNGKIVRQDNVGKFPDPSRTGLFLNKEGNFRGTYAL